MDDKATGGRWAKPLEFKAVVPDEREIEVGRETLHVTGDFRNGTPRLKRKERLAFVMALRRAGASLETIAQAAEERFGREALPAKWGPAAVRDDVKASLRATEQELAEHCQALRLLEFSRLESLLSVYWPKALQGQRTSADLVMRIIRDEIELFGLRRRMSDDELDRAIEGELAQLARLASVSQASVSITLASGQGEFAGAAVETTVGAGRVARAAFLGRRPAGPEPSGADTIDGVAKEIAESSPGTG